MRLAANAVSISHTLASQLISNGDVVVDATAGNGYDTIMLAQLVGPSGHVYAFDIQQQAILATKEKLSLAKLGSRVSLIKDGHENIDLYIRNKVKLVLFNLGYLPKGDKKIITTPHTTLVAIKKSLSMLQLFGAILLTVYTGHPGGQEEWTFIKSFLTEIRKEQFDVILFKYLNRNSNHPFTVMVQLINDIVSQEGVRV